MKRVLLQVLFLFAATLQLYAEPATVEQVNPLDAIVGMIAEQSENFTLDEEDFKTIQRKGNTYLIPRRLKQKVLFNIPHFDGQVTVSRVSSQKKVVGFRIESIASRSIFSYLGVRIGDIVRSVNGRAILTESDALGLISELSASEQAQVQIERGPTRQPLSLTYRLIG